MAKATRPLPTDAELEILQVFWTRGASTLREVFERFMTWWTDRAYHEVIMVLLLTAF
jgi:hypothetical protein